VVHFCSASDDDQGFGGSTVIPSTFVVMLAASLVVNSSVGQWDQPRSAGADSARNGVVNSGDKNLVRAEIGSYAAASPVFWYDLDRNGAINAADANLCTAQIGTGLHVGCP